MIRKEYPRRPAHGRRLALVLLLSACAPLRPAEDRGSHNGRRDFDETDADCGGPVAPRCGAGQACLVDGDCAANVCLGGRCRQLAAPAFTERRWPLGRLLPADLAALPAAGGGTIIAVAGDLGVQLLDFDRHGNLRRRDDHAVGLADAVAGGDFDGDGRRELAVAQRQRDRVVVLSPTGALGPPVPLAGGPVALAAGRLDGDGVDDLAVATTSTDEVVVLLGDRGGLRATARAPAPAAPRHLALGDLDGDGRPDVVATGAEIAWLGGDGRGSLRRSLRIAIGGWPTATAVADLDGDRRLDLLAVDVVRGGLRVLPGRGSDFGEALVLPTVREPLAVAVLDANGDGHLDAAVLSDSAPHLGLHLGIGDGRLIRSAIVDLGGRGHCLLAADLNGDQAPDLAVGLGEPPTLLLLFGVPPS